MLQVIKSRIKMIIISLILALILILIGNNVKAYQIKMNAILVDNLEKAKEYDVGYDYNPEDSRYPLVFRSVTGAYSGTVKNWNDGYYQIRADGWAYVKDRR